MKLSGKEQIWLGAAVSIVLLIVGVLIWRKEHAADAALAAQNQDAQQSESDQIASLLSELPTVGGAGTAGYGAGTGATPWDASSGNGTSNLDQLLLDLFGNGGSSGDTGAGTGTGTGTGTGSGTGTGTTPPAPPASPVGPVGPARPPIGLQRPAPGNGVTSGRLFNAAT